MAVIVGLTRCESIHDQKSAKRLPTMMPSHEGVCLRNLNPDALASVRNDKANLSTDQQSGLDGIEMYQPMMVG